MAAHTHAMGSNPYTLPDVMVDSPGQAISPDTGTSALGSPPAFPAYYPTGQNPTAPAPMFDRVPTEVPPKFLGGVACDFSPWIPKGPQGPFYPSAASSSPPAAQSQVPSKFLGGLTLDFGFGPQIPMGLQGLSYPSVAGSCPPAAQSAGQSFERNVQTSQDAKVQQAGAMKRKRNRWLPTVRFLVPPCRHAYFPSCL